MRVVSIDAEHSPLTLLTLVFKLKVRDVMTPRPITVSRHASLREAQQLLKQNSISGLPVVEQDRLFGIVSLDDIMRALDEGFIRERVEQHMTRNVIVLEEEMPLTFAMSSFNKYPFGRFPVINRERKVTGIVTSRNINVSLLTGLFDELRRIESERAERAESTQPDARHLVREYPVQRHDFEHGGQASIDIKKTLEEKGVNPSVIRRVAIAAYEMEMNQVVHSQGGSLAFLLNERQVELVAQDQGPGMEDADQAMEEGFSTANDWIRSLGFGAGMGLPNIRRMADRFRIDSAPGLGTRVEAVIHLDQGAES